MSRLGTEKQVIQTKMTSILRHFIDERFQIQKMSQKAWFGSMFEDILFLGPDHSGKVGEHFIATICQRNKIEHAYTWDDKNSTDGTYDIIIRGRKIEVKTARLGVQKCFQHENLRGTGCEYHFFVDVAPDHIYLTILPTFDMTIRHPIIGRKPHLRKGTTDVFKFDFGEVNLKNPDITLKIGAETSLEVIGQFIQSKIVPL